MFHVPRKREEEREIVCSPGFQIGCFYQLLDFSSKFINLWFVPCLHGAACLIYFSKLDEQYVEVQEKILHYTTPQHFLVSFLWGLLPNSFPLIIVNSKTQLLEGPLSTFVSCIPWGIFWTVVQQYAICPCGSFSGLDGAGKWLPRDGALICLLLTGDWRALEEELSDLLLFSCLLPPFHISKWS